jgi:hypothetical protein
VNARVREAWAATKVHVWPGRYRLVSLPVERLAEAAAVLAEGTGYGALVVERDEVSLTLDERRWARHPLRPAARSEAGPYRAVTLDVNLDLGLTGFLAPAAARLAQAGVPILPQCGFLKDHLLVREEDLARAVAVLEDLVSEASAGAGR